MESQRSTGVSRVPGRIRPNEPLVSLRTSLIPCTHGLVHGSGITPGTLPVETRESPNSRVSNPLGGGGETAFESRAPASRSLSQNGYGVPNRRNHFGEHTHVGRTSSALHVRRRVRQKGYFSCRAQSWVKAIGRKNADQLGFSHGINDQFAP